MGYKVRALLISGCRSVVDCLLWEQEAGGSSPSTRTKQTQTATKGLIFKLLVRVQLCELFRVSSNGQDKSVMRLVFIPPLCNGSISDFDSESVGSSPAGGAIWEFRLTGKAAFRHCLDARQRQQLFSFAFRSTCIEVRILGFPPFLKSRQFYYLLFFIGQNLIKKL